MKSSSAPSQELSSSAAGEDQSLPLAAMNTDKGGGMSVPYAALHSVYILLHFEIEPGNMVAREGSGAKERKIGCCFRSFAAYARYCGLTRVATIKRSQKK